MLIQYWLHKNKTKPSHQNPATEITTTFLAATMVTQVSASFQADWYMDYNLTDLSKTVTYLSRLSVREEHSAQWMQVFILYYLKSIYQNLKLLHYK